LERPTKRARPNDPSIDRKCFLSCSLGSSSLPSLAFAATTFPSWLLAESAEDICQNGGLVEERAIPGAYTSVCMSLPERVVPLPRLQRRLHNSKPSGAMIIRQLSGGSGATGMSVWNSGLILARLLDEIVERLSASPGLEDFWSGQDVLELGCGTGIGSIAAHLLGARSVIATDGNENVLELARANIRRNCIYQGLPSIEAYPLQWGLLSAIDFSESASLVIGADLTYNAGSWRVLAESMATVLSFDRNGHIIYLSLGHEGFNVNAEMDGFLSVAKEVGLVTTSNFHGIDVSVLLQHSLTSEEKNMLDQSGEAKVVVLKRKANSQNGKQ
jgi:predicted nicotinamide N-methyase